MPHDGHDAGFATTTAASTTAVSTTAAADAVHVNMEEFYPDFESAPLAEVVGSRVVYPLSGVPQQLQLLQQQVDAATNTTAHDDPALEAAGREGGGAAAT